jgi:hypothetical protein
MPFPASQTQLERLHTVPNTFGTFSHRSLRLGRIWDTCTPSPVSQTRLERLHAVFSVSDAFGTLERGPRRLKCV